MRASVGFCVSDARVNSVRVGHASYAGECGGIGRLLRNARRETGYGPREWRGSTIFNECVAVGEPHNSTGERHCVDMRSVLVVDVNAKLQRRTGERLATVQIQLESIRTRAEWRRVGI